MGCQMNEADSRHLASQLETIGYQPQPVPEGADVVVMNTCVVRQQAEDKIYGRLGSLKTVKERFPQTILGVMGCLVGVKEAPTLQKRFPYVDVFMPPSDTSPLFDYLENRDLLHDVPACEQEDRSVRDMIQDSINLLPAEQRGRAVTAFVPVVLGCSHACTFCIIPYRRGVERSRPSDDIIREVRSLVSQGIREVMLLGQIVDRYGLDLDTPSTLSHLLREVARVDGLERLRFLTSHPNWMTDALLDTIGEEDKVCPHIELPVQAGNNDVLERMRRGYTVEDYLAIVERIRDRLPTAALHTDIIVGFPGESETQFMDTHRLMETVGFDKVHLSKYSTRPKTVAARKMTDNVTDAEKSRRRDLLDALQKQTLTTKNRTLIGETVSVLVEGKQNDRWRGRTPQNKLVFFQGPEGLLGDTVEVTVGWAGPYSLVGRPLAGCVQVS